MKISIVTICYNAEKGISKTMESILGQKVPVWEYILVDGGSTDGTNEIIEKYKQIFIDRGILFMHISEPDKGIGDAFNKGIQNASGEYIGLVNAEDELLSNAVEILESVDDWQNFDIIYGNCIWVDSKNRIEYIRKSNMDLTKLYYKMVIMHPSTFVKRSAYERFGYFNVDYKYCMDQELLLRMYLDRAKFKYIDREFTKFRAGGVSDACTISSIREGIQLGLKHGASPLKVIINAIRNILQFEVSNILKRIGLFSIIRLNVKEIDRL